jgi:hypothetical protein
MARLPAFVKNFTKSCDLRKGPAMSVPALTSLNPAGTRDPDSCYPTARMLVTLPAGGPSGKTFFDEREYPMFELFVKGVRHPQERT